MKKVYLLGFLLALLFIPTQVQAKIGVGVTTGKIEVQEKLKPGIIYKLPILTVVNTGDEESDYAVEISYHEKQTELRPNKNWFEFSPKEFHLKPGEAQKVEIKLNLPIKIEPGNYFAYLEGHPIKRTEKGQASIGIAAAAKLYFTVLPANPVLGIYYKLASFWKLNQPWSNRVAVVVGLIIVYWILNKFFGFQISFGKNKEKENPDE